MPPHPIHLPAWLTSPPPLLLLLPSLPVPAGAEIGVASTKAYTSQIVVITMLALALRWGGGRWCMPPFPAQARRPSHHS